MTDPPQIAALAVKQLKKVSRHAERAGITGIEQGNICEQITIFEDF